ncbi:DUF1217 domain-containing protein [Paracoccus litorisediminis]|uniref:DUF1217 domain-containing protein n=1 Tax=Paracoccus litorisediminis TaxID=2006130 RepID=UPI003733F393
MINTTGLSTMQALTLINRERDTFEEGVKNDVTAKREISAFRERIGSISNVDELMADYEVFSFVLKSVGMGDQVYAKGMIKKILTSDETDSKSLVNKLTNPANKILFNALEFDTEGNASSNFQDAKWVENMVGMYVDQQLVDSQGEINASLGDALSFQRNTAKFTSWYKVLADKDASRVLRVALGIPESVASGDIDAQKRLFEKKMDIADLQDPAKVQKLLRQYAAIEDANNNSTRTTSLLSLFSSAASSGTYSPILLDIDMVSAWSNRYR